MKTKRAQIEMVDWALVRRRFELLLLITVAELAEIEEFGEEEGEEEEDEEKSLFVSTMAELPSGKNTRRSPIPQNSLELILDLEDEEKANPIRFE